MLVRQKSNWANITSALCILIETLIIVGCIYALSFVLREKGTLGEYIVSLFVFYLMAFACTKLLHPMGIEIYIHDLFCLAKFEKENGLIYLRGYRKKIILCSSDIESWILIKHFLNVKASFAYFPPDYNQIHYELRFDLTNNKTVSYFLPYYITGAEWSENLRVATNEQVSSVLNILNTMLPNKQNPTIVIVKRNFIDNFFRNLASLFNILIRKKGGGNIAQSLPTNKNIIRIV